MNTIREQFNKPWVAGLVGLVVGLIFGLFVLGWWLWPVEWYDAAPEHLQAGYQEIYLRNAISAYATSQDLPTAQASWMGLGAKGATVLATIEANPGSLDPVAINNFKAAVSATPLPSTATGETNAGGTPETPAKGRSNLVVLLVVMCVVTLLVGGALVAYFIMQGRKTSTTITPQMQAQEDARQAEWTDYATIGEETPMAQFMASYRIGDDLFDDSFSIDSPAGEFMGECGVGISETIGVGEPKKVTAFEVWLFDKNDIQTVTKVLMSTHAFGDPGIRQKLEAKGEPMEVDLNQKTVLETATLRLVARVVDMKYGEGALPENSFFESLILELAVWQK